MTNEEILSVITIRAYLNAFIDRGMKLKDMKDIELIENSYILRSMKQGYYSRCDCDVELRFDLDWPIRDKLNISIPRLQLGINSMLEALRSGQMPLKALHLPEKYRYNFFEPEGSSHCEPYSDQTIDGLLV